MSRYLSQNHSIAEGRIFDQTVFFRNLKLETQCPKVQSYWLPLELHFRTSDDEVK
jgi:hypothetical protein